MAFPETQTHRVTGRKPVKHAIPSPAHISYGRTRLLLEHLAMGPVPGAGAGSEDTAASSLPPLGQCPQRFCSPGAQRPLSSECALISPSDAASVCRAKRHHPPGSSPQGRQEQRCQRQRARRPSPARLPSRRRTSGQFPNFPRPRFPVYKMGITEQLPRQLFLRFSRVMVAKHSAKYKAVTRGLSPPTSADSRWASLRGVRGCLDHGRGGGSR